MHHTRLTIADALFLIGAIPSWALTLVKQSAWQLCLALSITTITFYWNRYLKNKHNRMDKINALLEIAAGEIGVQEDPHGSNRGPRVDEYQQATNTQLGSPWCGCFAAWCHLKAGIAMPKVWLLPAAKNWFTPDRIVSAKEARPGDVFGIRSGKRIAHVGIVESISGGVVTTIEGNTNDEGSREGYEVCRRRRTVTSIAAFARWTESPKSTEA